ncbi:hypothetical protein ACJELG_25735, partial [Escherichia coli]
YQLPIQAPSQAALYAAFRLPKRCKIKKKNKKVLYKNMPVDKWITPRGGDFSGIERKQNL